MLPDTVSRRQTGAPHWPQLPPMRDELPTLPCDLTDYAVTQTGPQSWTADPVNDEELNIDVDALVAGPLIGVRRSDVPRLLIADDERFQLKLDHREGFILALIEYCTDVETLLDIAGLPASETLEILCGLCARNIVALTSP